MQTISHLSGKQQSLSLSLSTTLQAYAGTAEISEREYSNPAWDIL